MIYKYERILLNPFDLQPCQLLKELSEPAVNFYRKELIHFQYMDKPVITVDNYVLWHWENVLAARKDNVEEIECVIANDLHEDEVMRFICTGLHFKHLSYFDRYILIKHLVNYLRDNPEGQKWAEQIPSAQLTGKLAKIVDQDQETIKLYKRIGDVDPEILKREGELTLKQMEHHIKQLRIIRRDKALEATAPPPTYNPQTDQELAIAYVKVYIPKLGRSFDLALKYTDVEGKEFYSCQTKDGVGEMTFEINSLASWIKEFDGVRERYRNKLNYLHAPKTN